MRPARFSLQTLPRATIFSVIGVSALLAITLPADAVTIAKDHKGFQNIPWGTSLASQPHLTQARTGQHVTEYQLENGPPRFAETEVDSLLFSTVNGQFARVTIRYRGETIHRKIMTYLEHNFGVQERAPGRTVRGLNQQFNWQGTETEINLTYDANGERGFLFFNSRTLAPRFNDFMADTAD